MMASDQYDRFVPCQLEKISKRLYGESIPCDYLRTAPSRQIITNSNQPSRRVTQVRNRDKMKHLPLMIFIWLHSEDINFLNKCLFCSIKSLFISKNLSFVRTFSSVIHRLKRSHNRQTENTNCIHKVHRNMSNDVYIQSSGCF